MHQQVPYCVLVPPSYDTNKSGRYPVVYFLHGLGGNEQMFLDSGAWNLVEDEWEQHKIGEYLIVAPAGDTSFYINAHDGRRYEDFFVQEFMPFIEHRYRIRAVRASRGITGISMGGYGALLLAEKHPTLVSAVAVISPAIWTSYAQARAANAGAYASAAAFAANDAVTHAGSLASVPVRVAAGYDDPFYPGVQALAARLPAGSVVDLGKGCHDGPFFAAQEPASLQFLARNLT